MAHRIDPRFGNNLLDAHVLDRTGGPEDMAVDEILDLVDNGKICLLLPHSVQAEINHPNTPPDVKRRAAGLLFTMPVTLTPPERAKHAQIRSLLQGNARPGKHDADAFHVVESEKYGRVFITNDGRILRKAGEIRRILGAGFTILTPTEFLALYKQAEEERPR